MRIAYLDAFAGVSGDMTVGALLDLGVPLDAVRDAVATVGIEGVELSTERVFRHGIAATKFHVRVDGRHPDAPFDGESHGDAHAPKAGRGTVRTAQHVHVHEHDADVPHAHDAAGAHQAHQAVHHARHEAAHRAATGQHRPPSAPHVHGHRSYVQIRDLLAGSALSEPVRQRALDVFARLAQAEGQVHGVPPDAVEFHEVGARDAIVDVVGAALGFTHLGVEAIWASPLPLGQGRVRAAHGMLPVPGPAVTELLRGRAVRFEDGAAELVTPTGAAIVAALARPDRVPPLRPLAVGYGAGDRLLDDRPNLLRIVLGELDVASGADEVAVLEATIDDMNPQLYDHVLERLFAAGARDAFLVPVVMKKSRPATMLRVLAAPADRERLAAIMFTETSTIGLRWTTWQRLVLPREERTVDTPWGTVRVKVSTAPDGTQNVAPEFDDCRRLACERGVPLKLVHQAALAAALR